MPDQKTNPASSKPGGESVGVEQSLSLLRATLESTADGILVVDRGAEKITSYNRNFADMWRIPEDVLQTGDDRRTLALAASQVCDEEKFVAKVRELYDQPEAKSFDVIEFKDGRVFERYSQPQRLGGKTVGRVWSFRDVTERKRTETELRVRNEALAVINAIASSVNRSLDFQSVVRRAVEALANYTHSPSVALYLINETAGRLEMQWATGFFEETIKRGTWLPLEGSLNGQAVKRREVLFCADLANDGRVEPKVVESLVAEGFRCALFLPLLNQERALGTMSLVFKQRRELSVTERETFLSIGQTIGLALANAQHVARIEAEVAERRRAEAALRQSEERFSKAFRSAPIGICLSQLEDGKILDANDTFLKMYGLTRAETIGRTSVELGLWAEVSERARLVEHLKAAGAIKGFEGTFRRKSGETGMVFSAVEKIDLDGVPCAVTLQNDITERKIAEDTVRKSREQLRALLARLQRAREEERTRIAREVHDVLGQLLTGLKMDLAWCERRLPQIANVELRRALLEKNMSVNQLADAMIETVQKISSELRPSLLDNLGLAAAVKFETRQFQRRTGHTCKITSLPEALTLSPDRATGMFRIFQEILTNVARHAQATAVRISLFENHGRLVLEVSDNGRGASEQELADPKSLGLLSMRERTALMGGEIQFRGVPEKGTTVTLTIPLKEGK